MQKKPKLIIAISLAAALASAMPTMALAQSLSHSTNLGQTSSAVDQNAASSILKLNNNHTRASDKQAIKNENAGDQREVVADNENSQEQEDELSRNESVKDLQDGFNSSIFLTVELFR